MSRQSSPCSVPAHEPQCFCIGRSWAKQATPHFGNQPTAVSNCYEICGYSDNLADSSSKLHDLVLTVAKSAVEI
ncbi:hypothetical protein BDR03DRAFT_969683 [Suillus americanus]|nr:hypothetical protein BDR03DRAFT_969683 [Suillus americanus]